VPPLSETDVSYILLEKTFGSFVADIRDNIWGDGTTGDSDGKRTVLTNLVTVMTWITLFVGTLLIGYTAFIGIINTAHDGEVLGRQWSSIWIPLRAAVGIGMISPIQSLGGLALVQTLILGVAMLGASVANVVWESAIKLIATAPIVQLLPDPGIYDLGESVLRSQVCIKLQRKHTLLNDEGRGLYRNNIDNTNITNVTDGSTRITVTYKAGAVSTGGESGQEIYGDCGNLTVTTEISGNDLEVTRIRQKFYSRYDGALNTLWDALLPLSDKIATSADTEFGEAFNDADRETYNRVLLDFFNTLADYEGGASAFEQQTPKSTITSGEKIAQDFGNDAVKGGWGLGGTYYWKIASWSEAYTSTVHELSTKKFCDPFRSAKGSCGNTTKNGFAGYKDEFIRQLNLLDTALLSAKRHPDAFRVLNKNAGGKSGTESSEIQSLVTSITTKMRETNINITEGKVRGVDVDPLLAMRDIGSSIIQLLSNYIVNPDDSKDITNSLGDVLKKVGGASKSKDNINATLLSVIVLSFISLGIVLAFVLPSLPYMLWVSGMLAYLIYVVEAVIAAPLWAIMHAHPEGHSAAGKGTQGYWMVAGLLARPFLMVLGLIAAMVLFRVIAWFVNYTIWDTMVIMHEDGSNVIAAAGLMIIYTSIMISVCYKCFGLIYELPKWFFSWVGGSDYHGDMGEQKMLSTAGGASSQASSATQRGAMSLGKGGDGGTSDR